MVCTARKGTHNNKNVCKQVDRLIFTASGHLRRHAWLWFFPVRELWSLWFHIENYCLCFSFDELSVLLIISCSLFAYSPKMKESDVWFHSSLSQKLCRMQQREGKMIWQNSVSHTGLKVLPNKTFPKSVDEIHYSSSEVICLDTNSMKTKYVTAEDPAGIIHLLDTSYLDYWIGLNLKVET